MKIDTKDRQDIRSVIVKKKQRIPIDLGSKAVGLIKEDAVQGKSEGKELYQSERDAHFPRRKTNPIEFH